MKEKSFKYVNKNFIVENPELRHAFKCCIDKVDNKMFLVTQQPIPLSSDD